MLKIAVIGGGHGAYAAAADLAEKGHKVRLWRRDREAFRPVIEKQAINLMDQKGTRLIRLDLASSDLEEVIKDAEVLVIPLPATAQESLAGEMAPFLKDGQVILLCPGTFGSYVMAQRIREAGCRAALTFAETGTLPYLARKRGSDTAAITTRATRLPTGVFPSERSNYAFRLLNEIYPATEPLEDGLDGALMNAGPVIHPPLVVLNAGPIEHFDHWDIHNEGTQPAVRRVHDALDAERIAVREALGYGPPHFPLADHYNHDGGDEWMYGNAAHEKLVDSEDWREPLDLIRHRYMSEDIGCGLAFLVSVGEWAGVDVPVARGLLSIASAMVGRDLRYGERTMEGIGLKNLSLQGMKNLLSKGLPE